MSTEQEVFEESAVRQLCKEIGYGRVMQLASQLWHREDPVGALSVGVPYGSMSNIDDDYRSTFNALLNDFHWGGDREYLYHRLGLTDGDIPSLLFAAAEAYFEEQNKSRRLQEKLEQIRLMCQSLDEEVAENPLAGLLRAPSGVRTATKAIRLVLDGEEPE